MKVHAYRDGEGTTLVVGQQGIDLAVPPGGVVELEPGDKPSFFRAVVRNRLGKPVTQYDFDERDVPRPISVSQQL